MRRAAVTVSIKGHDVTLDLMPYLVSLTYTDKADEELDDLQIVLEDREGIWQGDWLPQTGDVIEASILTENWREIGAVEELPCGTFEVDEMELESSVEGGDTVTVKAVPAAVKSSLMLQKKTRSWEKTPITTVIADIAGAAGLDTLYRGPELVYERVEQRQESDLGWSCTRARRRISWSPSPSGGRRRPTPARGWTSSPSGPSGRPRASTRNAWSATRKRRIPRR